MVLARLCLYDRASSVVAGVELDSRSAAGRIRSDRSLASKGMARGALSLLECRHGGRLRRPLVSEDSQPGFLGRRLFSDESPRGLAAAGLGGIRGVSTSITRGPGNL